MTEFLTVPGGSLAYEVEGAGPLVVLAHGMGDTKEAFRFLMPRLVAAGYRVAALDLRGCGESSAVWESYTRTAIAGDLLALVRHLGGRAVLVGHSISGGAVTIAAAEAPELITGAVEIGPFTRKQQFRVGDLAVGAYRRGTMHLLGTVLLGSFAQWRKYLDVAHPGVKPTDWDARLQQMSASLREPGRMKVLQKMGTLPPVDAGAALPRVACPVLVVQGSADPDWVSPEREARAIVDLLPAGLGTVQMVDGAGHYPHVQHPAETLAAMLPFLAAVAQRSGGTRA